VLCCCQVKDAVLSVYTHYHAPEAREVYRRVTAMALADMMDSRMFQVIFNPGRASSDPSEAPQGGGGEGEDGWTDLAGAVPRNMSSDAVSAVSLDLQRCSVTDLYAKANRDGARLNKQMLEIESIRCSVASEGSTSSGEEGGPTFTVRAGSSEGVGGGSGSNGYSTVTHPSSSVAYDSDSETTHSDATKTHSGGASRESPSRGDRVVDAKKHRTGHTNDASANLRAHDTNHTTHVKTHARKGSLDASSESGASVHSDDLFDDLEDTSGPSHPRGGRRNSLDSNRTIRSSQTVASVLSLFDSIVQPYQAKVNISCFCCCCCCLLLGFGNKTIFGLQRSTF
jgi:hypothetical protein